MSTRTPTSTVRRTQILASVLLALAALALWGASRLRWARVEAEDGLAPMRSFDVTGADWSPWLTPLALVLLAAILAAMSLRGWGLRVVAILVALGGVVAAFPAISLVVDGSDSLYAARAADIPDRYVVRLVATTSWVSVVVLAGTLCAVAAGVLLLRVASGAGLSSKYKTPAARREEVEAQIFADHERRKAAASGSATGPSASGGADSGASDASMADATPDGPGPSGPNERMMWDALDTGIDPTDPQAGLGSGKPTAGGPGAEGLGTEGRDPDDGRRDHRG